MIDLSTVQSIEAAIDDLAREFGQAPGLLLTEEDLRCQLMARFAQIGDLGSPAPSADDGVLATAIHADVSWFDEKNQLRLRPDITVTDPKHLSIQRAMQEGIPLPHKGFHFTGNSVLLELKFYRGRDGIRPTALPAIRKDIEKLERLLERGRLMSPTTFLHGVVVVFGKYSRISPEVAALATRAYGQLSVIVRSAGVQIRTTARRLECA